MQTEHAFNCQASHPRRHLLPHQMSSAHRAHTASLCAHKRTCSQAPLLSEVTADPMQHVACTAVCSCMYGPRAATPMYQLQQHQQHQQRPAGRHQRHLYQHSAGTPASRTCGACTKAARGWHGQAPTVELSTQGPAGAMSAPCCHPTSCPPLPPTRMVDSAAPVIAFAATKLLHTPSCPHLRTCHTTRSPKRARPRAAWN